MAEKKKHCSEENLLKIIIIVIIFIILVRVIKSITLRWSGNVGRMEEDRNDYGILTGKPTEKSL